MEREQLLHLLLILGEAQGNLYKGMKAHGKIQEAIELIKPCIDPTK